MRDVNIEALPSSGRSLRVHTPWGELSLRLQEESTDVGTRRLITIYGSDLETYALESTPPGETDPYEVRFVYIDGSEESMEVSP